jgi:putative inorganic carbon (HCO3(-)) transporter
LDRIPERPLSAATSEWPFATLPYLSPSRIPAITGGPLVWATAVAVAFAVYATGAAIGRSAFVIPGGLSLIVPLVFAWRLEAGVLLVVVARPSLDVFADRTFASFAGVQLNPASMLAVLVIAIGLPYMAEHFRELRRAPAIFPFLAFAGIAGVGIAVAPSTGSAATEWLRLSSILVIYALAYLAAGTRAAVGRLLGAILLSATLPIAVGLWQLAKGGTVQIGDYHRLTGTFVHPDPYGIYLALIVVAACAVAIGGRSLWRWAALATTVGAIATLIGSYTRTGWVMVGVGVLILGLVRYRALLILAPVVAILLVVAIPSTSARVHDLSNPKTQASTRRPGNSFNSRVQLWRDNLPAARAKPITGQGLNFIVQQTSNQAHVHSDYLRALVETGMFGFVAYVSLMLAALSGCVWSIVQAGRGTSRVLRTAALIGLASGTCFVLASGDSNLMTQVAVSGTAWALFACAHAAGRVARDANRPSPLTGQAVRHARLLGSIGVRVIRPGNEKGAASLPVA